MLYVKMYINIRLRYSEDVNSFHIFFRYRRKDWGATSYVMLYTYSLTVRQFSYNLLDLHVKEEDLLSRDNTNIVIRLDVVRGFGYHIVILLKLCIFLILKHVAFISTV